MDFSESCLPLVIRVSIGSAIKLELTKGALDAEPTTAYLLSYVEGKCSSNCAFCSQARESSSRADMLSRVTWPIFNTERVVQAIRSSWKKDQLHRVCLQTVNHNKSFEETIATVVAIRNAASIPISVSCMPFNKSEMKQLKKAGVDRIGIPLDASTKELFDRLKGSSAGGLYQWESHIDALQSAVKIFGKGEVSTHLIVGLGETDRELLDTVQKMAEIGVYPGLFAFTPIPGSKLEKAPQPNLGRYHKLQLAHHLLTKEISRFKAMAFDSEGNLLSFGVSEELLRNEVLSGVPFVTSGCPDCNRPYYNERPGGKLYNYPEKPKSDETTEILKEILK